jgi:hypothetical protein
MSVAYGVYIFRDGAGHKKRNPAERSRVSNVEAETNLTSTYNF